MSSMFDTKEWDRVSVRHRIKMLQNFYSKLENMPLHQFQAQLYPEMMLIFARVSAFFRMNYMHDRNSLDLQLLVLQLFLRDQMCHTQFLYVGGATVLLDVLLMQPTKQSQKKAQKIVLQILHKIASSGNSSDVELVCTNNGLKMLAQSMRLMIDDESEQLCRSLYLSLLESNRGIIPNAIESLIDLIRTIELPTPILISCFILKGIAKNHHMGQLAKREAINSLFPHLFHKDTHVQLEIQELIIIALVAAQQSDEELDTVQFISQKIIATLTKYARYDEESSFYQTIVTLRQLSEHETSQRVADIARFVSRLLQKESISKVSEFLIDSQFHLLLLDSIIATSKSTGHPAKPEKTITDGTVVSMLKESSNCIRVCRRSPLKHAIRLCLTLHLAYRQELFRFEERNDGIPAIATKAMIRVLGPKLCDDIKGMEVNDNISIYLELFQQVNENEAMLTQTFTNDRSWFGAKN